MTHILKISGAELKQKSDMAKLVGSAPGYVGSDKQLSMLSKFIAENPSGGVIVIEEADYMHQDIVQFFTNMKSDKRFNDGLGKPWDVSQYIIVQNTNIGQELMLPPNAKNKMTWEQNDIRISQITEEIDVEGEKIRVVKKEYINKVQEDYIGEIVMKSNPNGDTSQIAQEANKQKRRDKNIYVMPPTKEDLLEVAQIKVEKLKKEYLMEYKIELSISPRSLRRIVDVDHYDFFKGYSYIEEQLEKNISSQITKIRFREGDKIQVQVIGDDLVIKRNEITEIEKPLILEGASQNNPWRASEKMRDNINNIALNMSKTLKGSSREIFLTKELLQKSLVNFQTRKVITLIGTTGNGKTQYAKSLAQALYNSKEAYFPVTGLNSPHDLSSYFRPAAGLIGSNKETEFEQWFKARQKAGGGVILFDELLSYGGLNQQQLGDKVAVFNELYSLLDEGKIKIAGNLYDASSFMIVLTGNSMQEAFTGLPNGPDGERQARKIELETSHDDIVKYFSKLGIDPPKVARMGTILLKGPLSQEVSKQIVNIQTNSNLAKLIESSGYNIELKVSQELMKVLSEKVPTSSLGFRNVEQAMQKALEAPITGILASFDNISSIEASLSGKEIIWAVNGQKVILVSEYIEELGAEDSSWKFENEVPSTKTYKNITPNLETVIPKIDANQGLAVKIVSIHELEGHWMANVLLNGTNGADFVSIIPGDGYLGYVRPRESQNAMNFSSLVKRMIILEAGHRSVINRGIHALGGGTAKRNPNEYPTDDLGKIDLIMDQIINNKIFPEVSENSTEEQKKIFKTILHEIIQETTDTIIKKGLELKISQPVMKKLQEDTYLTGDFLDSYVDSKLKEISLDPNLLFEESFETSYQKIIDKQPLWKKYVPNERKAILKLIKEKTLEDLKHSQNLDCNHLFK